MKGHWVLSMKSSIGLVVKRDIRARNKAGELETWLTNKGFSVVYENDFPDAIASDRLRFVIVLGGDGTFLSAARLIGNSGVPLMGIKFGEVGFLAETIEDDLFKSVEAVLNGNHITEERMRLSVTVERSGSIIVSVDVLNDVVLNKGALSRLAHCTVFINESYLTTYKADGLIVGTPTGSTAYSLAAGGPVIHPTVPGIILTPICPFTLTNSPLIIPDTSSVEIRLEGKPSDIILTLDGQEGLNLHTTDRIIVKRSDNSINMISLSNQSYFNVLKARLMWSGGRG